MRRETLSLSLCVHEKDIEIDTHTYAERKRAFGSAEDDEARNMMQTEGMCVSIQEDIIICFTRL